MSDYGQIRNSKFEIRKTNADNKDRWKTGLFQPKQLYFRKNKESPGTKKINQELVEKTCLNIF
ncbi:MAG: hypothetical protein A2X48_01445 [Lentisphaerae bacterium GWF2_49_21]|nr:MAG: hypothetical protein A2X48_01445 [Lentisphaerae bacterium GWF2_49_21]